MQEPGAGSFKPKTPPVKVPVYKPPKQAKPPKPPKPAKSPLKRSNNG